MALAAVAGIAAAGLINSAAWQRTREAEMLDAAAGIDTSDGETDGCKATSDVGAAILLWCSAVSLCEMPLFLLRFFLLSSQLGPSCKRSPARLNLPPAGSPTTVQVQKSLFYLKKEVIKQQQGQIWMQCFRAFNRQQCSNTLSYVLCTQSYHVTALAASICPARCPKTS